MSWKARSRKSWGRRSRRTSRANDSLRSVMTIIWRIILFLLGLLFLAIVVSDVYELRTHAPLLLAPLGVLHGLFFLTLGGGAVVGAVRLDGAMIRDLTVGFFRDVFSRKNVVEWSIVIIAAIVIAAALAWRHNSRAAA